MKKLTWHDGCELLGLGMIGIGVAFVHWPTALVILGVILLAVALWSRTPRKEAHNDRTIA